MVEGIVFLNEAIYILYIEAQSHVVAIDVQPALDEPTTVTLGFDVECVGEVLAWHSLVCFFVQYLVVDNGIVKPFLLVPLHLHIVVGGWRTRCIDDACCYATAAIHAQNDERQTNFLLVVSRQGEVLLSEEYLTSLDVEMEAVGIASLIIHHAEGDDAFFWFGTIAGFGCRYPCSLPVALHLTFTHLHVAIARMNLDEFCQYRVCHFSSLGFAHNLGKDLLGLVTHQE